MKICLIGKYPPIEGGVSAQTYWTCHLLARAGHQVFVVTNADETEPEHRMSFLPGDHDRLNVSYPGGGSVTVTFTQPEHDADIYYIPRGQPTTTRLAAVATEIVRRYDCELIIGWYLEPYAIAAALVAAWTRRPYVVRHAGSDLMELAAQPELGSAYREMLRNAAAVLSFNVPTEGLGMRTEQALKLPGLFMPAEFTPDGEVMDIAATARYLAGLGNPKVTRTDALPAGVPVLGMYGKLGVGKGTTDLIAAIADAKSDGLDISLALLGGGPEWDLVLGAVRDAGLADSCWTLPMLAPWRVPSFIRACDAIAYLERDFQVAQHRPVPPIEILACGTPVILSTDMVTAVLPGRDSDDPIFAAVETVDPRDAVLLSKALRSVFTRAGARPDVSASLRSEQTVAAWYGDVFARLTTGEQASDDAVGPDAVAAMLARHCPASARVMGARLTEEIDRTRRTAPNLTFAVFAALNALVPDVRQRQEDANRPELDDLEACVAEYCALWARLDVEGLAGIPMFELPVQRVLDVATCSDDELARLKPIASTWLRLERFEIDTLGYLSELGNGRPAPAAPSAPHWVMFHKSANLTRSIVRVGGAVVTLLKAADGRTPIGALVPGSPVDGTAAWSGRGLADWRRIISDLHGVGAISFVRPAIRER